MTNRAAIWGQPGRSLILQPGDYCLALRPGLNAGSPRSPPPCRSAAPRWGADHRPVGRALPEPAICRMFVGVEPCPGRHARDAAGDKARSTGNWRKRGRGDKQRRGGGLLPLRNPSSPAAGDDPRRKPLGRSVHLPSFERARGNLLGEKRRPTNGLDSRNRHGRLPAACAAKLLAWRCGRCRTPRCRSPCPWRASTPPAVEAKAYAYGECGRRPSTAATRSTQLGGRGRQA